MTFLRPCFTSTGTWPRSPRSWSSGPARTGLPGSSGGRPISRSATSPPNLACAATFAPFFKKQLGVAGAEWRKIQQGHSTVQPGEQGKGACGGAGDTLSRVKGAAQDGCTGPKKHQKNTGPQKHGGAASRGSYRPCTGCVPAVHRAFSPLFSPSFSRASSARVLPCMTHPPTLDTTFFHATGC